jgi:hypothetical protein
MSKGMIWILSVALVAALFALVPWNKAGAAEKPKEGVELGTLTCTTRPKSKINKVIVSSISANCVFKTKRGEERYSAEIGLLGVDLSKKEAQKLYFTVVGLTEDIRMGTHTLAGHYIGLEATLGLGVGGGAQALVGGVNHAFSLAPSLETHKGLGATLGGTRMNLKPAK